MNTTKTQKIADNFIKVYGTEGPFPYSAIAPLFDRMHQLEAELAEIKEAMWPNQAGLPNEHRNAAIAIKASKDAISKRAEAIRCELVALHKRYADDVAELNARLIQRREDYAAHSVKQAQEMQSLCVQLEQSQAREAQLLEALRSIDLSPCDGGSCEVATMADELIQAALSQPAPPVVPLAEVKPIREALERYRMRLDDGKHDQSAEDAILIFDTKYPAL